MHDTYNVIDAGLLGSGLACDTAKCEGNQGSETCTGHTRYVPNNMEQQYYKQLVWYYTEPSHSKTQQKYQAWKCPLELERETPNFSAVWLIKQRK